MSDESLAQFEDRVRGRRIDRQIAIARQALEEGRIDAVQAAVDDVRTLDPARGEIASLEARLAVMRAAAPPAHLRTGPKIAAAVVFAGLVLGASWLEKGSILALSAHESIVVVGTVGETAVANAIVTDRPKAEPPAGPPAQPREPQLIGADAVPGLLAPAVDPAGIP
jgi:hypothetical protein